MEKNYEEVFITDYEAPFEINEYDNINALNEKVKKIASLDEEGQDILYSLLSANDYDFDELFDKIKKQEYFYIPQGSVKDYFGNNESSDIDLAVGYIDAIGGLDALSKKEIEDNFNYEKFGQSLSWKFTATDKGYVFID